MIEPPADRDRVIYRYDLAPEEDVSIPMGQVVYAQISASDRRFDELVVEVWVLHGEKLDEYGGMTLTTVGTGRHIRTDDQFIRTLPPYTLTNGRRYVLHLFERTR